MMKTSCSTYIYTIEMIIYMHENMKKIKTWRKRMFDHCVKRMYKK